MSESQTNKNYSAENIKVLEGDSFQDNMQLIEIIDDEVVVIEINEQMYEYYMNGEIKISDG